MRSALPSPRIVPLLSCTLLLAASAAAQSVVLDERDAEVWGVEQVVEGRAEGVAAGRLFVNDAPLDFEAAGGAFAVPVRLAEGVNTLVACAADGSVCSDTVRWTLGYALRPEVELRAETAGRDVTLRGRVLANPEDDVMTFTWAEDAGNPQALGLSVQTDTLATAFVPAGAPEGEYYFDLNVETDDDDAFRARTFVTVTENGVRAFDPETEHAAWVEDAVVYEIPPRFFANVQKGTFNDITIKIPELVELGINTIWLQPIYATHQGWQAYDVTGYFTIWDVLGTAEDLHRLIDTAHEAGLRVMFDFVANHSSIHHPYAQHAIEHGTASYYYDFYMRERDGAPYGNNYHQLRRGEMTFVYYFWEDLVTFDYANPDVDRFIIEASRYWVEEFDIDGYRFDAVWGPHARDPAFTNELRMALKRVKPELLLLAEAKAPYSEAYFGTSHPSIFESFDAAYDWTDEDDYISQWAFQKGFDRTTTLFNTGFDRFRTRDLRNALTNYGQGFDPDALVFRYLENNDTPRFRAYHSDEQVRMAAALLFALDGVPMLYYGQEVGMTVPFPSFPSSRSIRYWDEYGFWPYFQHLIRLRTSIPALTSPGMEEIAVGPDGVDDFVYAFRRWTAEQHVLAVVNMGAEAATATLSIPVADWGLAAGGSYYLTDLFSGEAEAVTGADLAALAVDLPAHTTRLLVVADEAVPLPTGVEDERPDADAGFALEANYPNPFAGRTAVPFVLERGGAVRLVVHDLLGREVAVLEDGWRGAGRHEVVFDAGALPSGLYFVRLDHEGRQAVRPLMHLRRGER